MSDLVDRLRSEEEHGGNTNLANEAADYIEVLEYALRPIAERGEISAAIIHAARAALRGQCPTCAGTGVGEYVDHGSAQFGEQAIEAVKCEQCDGPARLTCCAQSRR